MTRQRSPISKNANQAKFPASLYVLCAGKSLRQLQRQRQLQLRVRSPLLTQIQNVARSPPPQRRRVTYTRMLKSVNERFRGGQTHRRTYVLTSATRNTFRLGLRAGRKKSRFSHRTLLKVTPILSDLSTKTADMT